MTLEQAFEPVVVVRGLVSPEDRDYAVRKVQHGLRFPPQPVLHLHLVVALEPDPARSWPAVVEATVDVNGRTVQTRAEAATVREAADRLDERLRRRLDRIAGARRPPKGGNHRAP